METIIIKAKTRKQAQEVVKKLKNMVGLQIQTKKTWEEIERSLPDVNLSDEEIMSEVRAVRYGTAK